MGKTLLEMYFNYLVVHTEELLEGVRTVITHTRDKDGFLVSLAQVCYKILNEPEWIQGSKSDSDRSSNREIFKILCNVREEGKASGEGVNFSARVLTKAGTMDFTHIIILGRIWRFFTKYKPLAIDMRCFPCFCGGCVANLK